MPQGVTSGYPKHRLALSCRTDPLRLAQCRPRVADGFGGQDQAPPDCGGVTPERVQRRVLEDFESPIESWRPTTMPAGLLCIAWPTAEKGTSRPVPKNGQRAIRDVARDRDALRHQRAARDRSHSAAQAHSPRA